MRERNHPSSDLLNTVIGPTQEAQSRRNHEAIQRQWEDGLKRAEARDKKERKLKEVYGGILVDAGVAFNSRAKPGSHGFVYYRGRNVRADSVRDLFSTVLSERIVEQPEDERSRWLSNLFEGLDRLR